MICYYAKSGGSAGKVSNQEHLAKTARQARLFGQEIGQPEAAELAGQLHDFGKYSRRFQDVLAGTCHGIDHALPGAAFLYYYKKLEQKKTLWPKYEPVVEAIQGHHDGLVSLQALAAVFRQVWSSPDADCCPSQKLPALCGPEQYTRAWQAFQTDFPGIRLPRLSPREYQNQTENMLDTRMLFSCLVDADYSVSASDSDPDYLLKNSGSPLDADAALKKLYARREELRTNSRADAALNAIRDQVFDACGCAGEAAPGLFTLTAPTGVGKTLAMLHFALRHCKKNGLRRIILVLPFLTLAEQSEQEYAAILPELLTDHSQSQLTEQTRELASRWDSPMILTTSVNFFESLFAARPTDCRKLHSIAGSVVLFDEAQSLPAELAPTTVQAVNALCRKYRCTMVFSTATQPDLSALPQTVWQPTEILPNNRELYARMRRVQVEWRLFKDNSRSQNPSLAEIASEMAQETSVCAILNLRRHARTLLEALRAFCPEEEVFLLTTDLCPAHRLEIVRQIKARLREGLPCRVVATQCIEAGVDLDFAVLYRALAPLESIIQAAGRCNRNGRLPQGGRVVVFEPGEPGRLYPGDTYERAASIVKMLWADRGALDWNDPEEIAAYYHVFFRDTKPKPALEAALDAKDYPRVAKEYRLISKTGVQVIVPWEGQRQQFEEIARAALEQSITASLLRHAAPLTVSCFEKDWVEQHATPLRFAGSYASHTAETGFYLLNCGHEHFYDNKMGLMTTSTMPEDFMA